MLDVCSGLARGKVLSYGENITVEYERVYQAKSSEIIVPQSHAVASRHNYSELTGYTLLHLAARL